MKKIFALFIMAILITGCVSKKKYERSLFVIDSLSTENARLSAANDELENGEARLINKYIDFVAHGKYIEAEDAYTTLSERHPNAISNKEFTNISQVKSLAKKQRDSLEKAERINQLLSNIDELGKWRIGDYVDDFDEPTGRHFVYQRIVGDFSNSATAGSPLSILIRVYKSTYSSYLTYDLEYDEYVNGTKDNSYYGTCKIVSKDLRKVYQTIIKGSAFRSNDDDDKTDYSLLDILRNGSTYEITDYHREYSLTTTYNYTIDSRYLDNALLKAGILDASDFMND